MEIEIKMLSSNSPTLYHYAVLIENLPVFKINLIKKNKKKKQYPNRVLDSNEWLKIAADPTEIL